jgi:hypothetical protein
MNKIENIIQRCYFERTMNLKCTVEQNKTFSFLNKTGGIYLHLFIIRSLHTLLVVNITIIVVII